jgi:hypothetical protein
MKVALLILALVIAPLASAQTSGGMPSDGSIPLELPKPVPDMPKKEGMAVTPGCRPENATERADRLAKQSARDAQRELDMSVGECPAGQVSTGIHFGSPAKQ